MKYFLVAGEASGDLHASNLMFELKKLDKEADFCFFGGDKMQSVGGKLIKHYRDLAYMGFIPVLMNLRTIFKNMNICREEIGNYQPDVVILVDYPGFNLRIAQYVKEKLHIPVYYYISPKIWAWKEYRIKNIRKYVDKMLCILPFEVCFYRKHQYPVDYVGNPTVDAINNRDSASESFEEFIASNQLDNKPVIAILAGSRKHEIKNNLPTMLKSASFFKNYQMVIAGAPGIDHVFYRKYTESYQVSVVYDQTYRLLQQAKAALVTSGTATLETALLKTPQVVCYYVPAKHIASILWKCFFKVKYISLVNLIVDKLVVKELFGKYFSAKQIMEELNLLINNESYREKIIADYELMAEKLGKKGGSENAAKIIYNSIIFEKE
ncbi:MAG: lipid-A-disaccharide synthase [Dysgonamonadaceae bacterium]|nr:lipid-A-disaccharide synthase [Dysgonamonadaceae bacterium]